MTLPKLEFLRNDAGEKEGLGDAGIETVRDTPYSSCAREAGQNSRDVAASTPVRLTFRVLEIPRADVPALDQLASALAACAAEATQEKDKDFFSNAISVVAADPIPVLEIADYDTKGLTGPPDRPGTPFHSLLKSAGVSVKDSDSSGGSFGIGKNASFAVSDLQMVLYATRYLDEGGALVYAAQGKARLTSHSVGSESYRGTGYWGLPGFKAITDPAAAPTWMQRIERGTTIFSVGFRESADWAEHMTSSLIANFFCAVNSEEMTFEVAEKYSINRNTLEGLLGDPAIRSAADNAGERPQLEFAGQLYRCLTSPNAQEHVIAVYGLGKVRVRVLVEPGLPNRIAFIRNGMLITDNLGSFGHTFSRFPGSRDFVAIVQPIEADAPKLFKQLENPAHRHFSAERIPDPQKRDNAVRAMKKLGNELRSLIRSSTVPPAEDTVSLDELAGMFADVGGGKPPKESDENDPAALVYNPPTHRPASPESLLTNMAGTGGGRSAKKKGTGTRTEQPSGGHKPGSGAGASGKKKAKEGVRLEDVRNVMANAPSQRIIHFTPSTSGTIDLSVEATGIDNPERLGIIGSTDGVVSGGTLRLQVTEGVRTKVTLTLDKIYAGPIEIIGITPDQAAT